MSELPCTAGNGGKAAISGQVGRARIQGLGLAKAAVCGRLGAHQGWSKGFRRMWAGI